MRRIACLGALLLMASCGAPSDESGETPLPVEPDGGIGDGAGPPGMMPGQASSIIPARYHGVWDNREGTCARNSDLRIEVSGEEVLFYESVGSAMSALEEDDITHVDLAMEGEGEEWTQTLSFKLVDGGDGLVLVDPELPEGYTEITLKRCAE